jgi:hypothetical protein
MVKTQTPPKDIKDFPEVISKTARLEDLRRQHGDAAGRLQAARADLGDAEHQVANGRDDATATARARALLAGQSLDETRRVLPNVEAKRRAVKDREDDLAALDRAVELAGNEVRLAELEAEKTLATQRFPEYRGLVAKFREALVAVQQAAGALAAFRQRQGPLAGYFVELELVNEMPMAGAEGPRAAIQLANLVRKGLSRADDYLESTGKDHA